MKRQTSMVKHQCIEQKYRRFTKYNTNDEYKCITRTMTRLWDGIEGIVAYA